VTRKHVRFGLHALASGRQCFLVVAYLAFAFAVVGGSLFWFIRDGEWPWLAAKPAATRGSFVADASCS